MLRPTWCKNIEQFCQRKFNKIKTENFREIEANFLVQLESHKLVGFLGSDFVILKPKVKKILNFE